MLKFFTGLLLGIAAGVYMPDQFPEMVHQYAHQIAAWLIP